MDFYIITGTSRGLGEAITRKLLVHGNTIFCVSRTMNEDLVETASSLHIPFFYHEADLSESGSSSAFMHEVFSHIDPERIKRIALINNAGMLEPVAPVESADQAVMEKHLKLNLLSPFILSSEFIARTQKLDLPKVILNISSGAAHYPYAGWSLYCASKAGLDMLSRTVGLEQSAAKYPVKILALAPGIVDTAMQTHIRQLDKNLFPEKDSFVQLHEQGKLVSADAVAGVIAAAVFNPEIPQGGLLSLEELKQFAK